MTERAPRFLIDIIVRGLATTCTPIALARLTNADASPLLLDVTASVAGHLAALAGDGDPETAVQAQNAFRSLNRSCPVIDLGQPRGAYPDSFNDEQSCWTIVGNEDAAREGLLNEDGRFEIDTQSPTLAPFDHLDGRLIS